MAQSDSSPDVQPSRRGFFGRSRAARSLRLVDDLKNLQDTLDIEPAAGGTDTADTAMTAAGEVLGAPVRSASIISSNQNSTWQSRAWDYYDSIGEVRYGLDLLGNLAQRAVPVPAVRPSNGPPVIKSSITDEFPNSTKTRRALRVAERILARLPSDSISRIAVNLSVAGECFLAHINNEYVVLSSEELTRNGQAGGWAIRQRRGAKPVALDPSTFVARIWNPHPRWRLEASSSMLGILDQCESLLLQDQMIRASVRSRISAGALFMPDTVEADRADIEEALVDSAVTPIRREDSAASIVPLLLTGPPEAGNSIRNLSLARPVDQESISLMNDTLDRILTGLNLPKELVRGLQDSKYANAIVIDDNMYRAHLAPLLDLIYRSLTKVFLRPLLAKEGVDLDLCDAIVIWYDPTQIVNRPDRGQAANDGYDRKVLSAAAWRTARGFGEDDAPDDDETFQRVIRERGAVPQDTAAAALESLGGGELRITRHQVNKTSPGAKVKPVPDETEPGPEQPPAARDRSDRQGGNLSPRGMQPPKVDLEGNSRPAP